MKYDKLVILLLFFMSLLFSIYWGIPLLYPLLLGLICFTLSSLRSGFMLNDLIRMMLNGSKRSLIVIKIFVLIGAITAVWRACGTVSFIVYYGTAFINEQYFVLCVFLLCCLVSFLLGTSFGTVGTIGLILMVLAKSGNIDTNVVAGAIIAGAYFGDRCSPMSSSAALVATLTDTNLYINIKNMFKSSIIPLALSIIGYIYLSHGNPLIFHDDRIGREILQLFDLPMIVILPALIILIAAVFKVDVKISMSLSIAAGILIAIFVQHQTLLEIINYILLGYSAANPGFFADIIKGGGLYSMLNVAFIVLISAAYAGIFEGTGFLKDIEHLLARISQKLGVYPTTMLTSTATAAFSCNQTLAVMLTHQIGYKIYESRGLNKYRLALDLENTVIMISALIPWNIAGAFPMAALSVDAGSLIYAVYLFMVPLTNMFTGKMQATEKG